MLQEVYGLHQQGKQPRQSYQEILEPHQNSYQLHTLGHELHSTDSEPHQEGCILRRGP